MLQVNPCPKCGEPPELEALQSAGFLLYCSVCFPEGPFSMEAFTGAVGVTPSKAVEHWNASVAPLPLANRRSRT